MYLNFQIMVILGYLCEISGGVMEYYELITVYVNKYDDVP